MSGAPHTYDVIGTPLRFFLERLAAVKRLVTVGAAAGVTVGGVEEGGRALICGGTVAEWGEGWWSEVEWGYEQCVAEGQKWVRVDDSAERAD